MFGLQGLWTAARERVPVTFVVFSNGEYRTLKQTLARMRGNRVDGFVGMDLDRPRSTGPRSRTRSVSPACVSTTSTSSPPCSHLEAPTTRRSWSTCQESRTFSDELFD